MDINENLKESDIQLTATVFPSGERDFCLWKTTEAGVRVPVNPLELLVLDRAVDAIDEQARSNEARAMNQALCRLLVPSVKTKRVGRHLVVEISDLKTFEANKRNLQIGRYLKIAQGNNDFTIAIIINIKGANALREVDGKETIHWTFQIECQPIGSLDSDGVFERGSILLPVPTEPVYMAEQEVLEKLFASSAEYDLPFGRISMNKDVQLHINGNRFFGKHIGIAGSTGSGKSCTVAAVLQNVVGVNRGINTHSEQQRNSHVVIFDIHSEYAAAFKLDDAQQFSVNLLNIDTLQLPYWLMNSEELVIEPWSVEVIRGETLADETRTSFSVELSQAQAEQWRVVQHSEEKPSGLVEEVFWDAVTELPSLQRQFDDPDLGKFGKAFYHHLIPPGEGREVVESWSNLAKKIERCRANDFRDLGLGFDRNYMRRLYRKYMAVTIRWTSKMTAQVARSVIDALHGGVTSLSPSEQVMHELRYGAAECFGKINVGYLFGCGPMFECFFNDIYRSIASEGAQSEHCQAMNELLRFVYLQRHYLELRKHARRDEKQQQRTSHQDSYPGQRKSPKFLVDPSARLSHDLAAISEEMLILQDEILPAMEREKPEQAKLLRLFIEHGGDVKTIADATGLSDRKVTRQLKETVFHTAQRTARRLKFSELLED